MTLRSKLLLGFCVMLVLTSIIAVTGWYATDRMDTQSRVVNGVEDSVTKVLLAQGSQLSYSKLKDKKLADNVNKFIAESRTSMLLGRSHMTNESNIRLANQGIEALDWYKTTFARLLEADDKCRTIDEGMVRGGLVIIDQFTSLSKFIENAIRGGNTTVATMNALVAVADAHLGFMNARLAARAFTANPNAEVAKTSEGQLLKAREHVNAALVQLRQPENQALAKEILKGAEAYIASFYQMRDSYLASNAISVEIEQRMEVHTENMHRLSRQASASVTTAKENSNRNSLIASALALLIGVGIAFGLAGNVQAQLGKDPSALGLIAQRVTDGDYNIDDGSPRKGVYGNLVGMVEALKSHIDNARQESERALGESERARQAMAQAEEAGKQAQSKTTEMLRAADKLEEVAGIVSSASAQLSAQIEQSERGAAEQASRVMETATAMDEMNATVLEVARNASQASDVSAVTRNKAEEGAQVVRQAVQSIQLVQKQSLALKEDMGALGQNAQAINQIMGVISDIADQTNLLALNAAIEAARAGDAGRGFAVVADEVRKLAEKTMESTTDVGNAIRAIQQSADKSMTQVDAAVKTIEEATNLATQSGKALGEIVSMVDSTADQVRAIATASEQQSASSEEITQSIGQVNNIAGETARAMQEASQAVSELSSQAQALSQLIDNMKRG